MSEPDLSKYRAKNSESHYVDPSGQESSRLIYHHDRAEVTYSPFFRRLAFRRYHFPNRGPANRTRLLHSIEVSTIASGMARRLGLDVDLTEAISLGHDIAQPPLGYPSESILRNFLLGEGFSHAHLGAELLRWHSMKKTGTEQSAELEARDCFEQAKYLSGVGISTLSREAFDGIWKHTTPPDGGYDVTADPPLTVEGQLVRIADTLAYISQEIDEAIQMDPKLATILGNYASKPSLSATVGTSTITMARDQLHAPPCSGSRQFGAEFLERIFGKSVGPRIVSMIARFEEYARADVDSRLCSWKVSKCCATQYPVLRFDPVLAFLIAFLWQDFIGNTVNQRRRIKRVVADTRGKISRLLDLLLANVGTIKDKEFRQRMKEVTDLMPGLVKGTDKFNRRVIANYVACLTDPEVDLVIGKLEGGTL